MKKKNGKVKISLPSFHVPRQTIPASSKGQDLRLAYASEH